MFGRHRESGRGLVGCSWERVGGMARQDLRRHREEEEAGSLISCLARHWDGARSGVVI